MSERSKFCPLPWLHSYIGLEGYHKVCCIGDEYKCHIKDEQGEKIHISQLKKPQEVLNTDYMKEIRLQLLNGEFPNQCSHCKMTEHLGGTSRREIEREHYQKLEKKLIAETAEDGSIQVKIRHLDYRLGNTCNLQCRMCNPEASSKWINDYEQLDERFKRHYGISDIEALKNIRWQNEDLTIEDLKLKIEHLDRLHFAGGEAFYVKNMLKMLQVCIDANKAQDIILTYNTNLSFLPDDLLAAWKHFKEVRLLVSIDGFGPVNDYIRYPSKWDVIDKNLNFLEKNHSDYKVTEIILSTTVQINNILHLEPLVNYLENFSFITPLPNVTMLSAPSFLKVSILPRPLKFIAVHQIDEIIKRYEGNIPERYLYLLKNFIRLKKEITAGLQSPHKELFGLFMDFSRIYDEKRQLDVLAVNPEFKNF